MAHFLYEHGLANATFLAALAVWLWCLFRPLPRKDWPGWKCVAVFLTLGAFGNIALAAYRSYVAPRDVLQDIVSADEFLHGRSLYPYDMNVRMRALLADRPLPSFDDSAKEARERALSQHWVQAHPPPMSLLFAGMLRLGGPLGAQILWALASAIAFVVLVRLLTFHFQPDWGYWPWLCAVLAALGWSSVFTCIKNGQADLILLALLAISWHYLRRERPITAGVAAGLAVSLKLMPGVILLVLLLRHRRAFLAALGTFALVNLGTLALVGSEAFQEYRRTADGVMKEYAHYSGNVSLLAAINRMAEYIHSNFESAKLIWMVLGATIVFAMIWLLKSSPKGDRRAAMNLEYALAIALMPVCSPVAWDHYLTFLLFPLAVLANERQARAQQITLMTTVLILAIPETTYQHLFRALADHGQWLNVWLLEPLRTMIVFFIASWLGFSIRSATS